jgi:hypothetical protein
MKLEFVKDTTTNGHFSDEVNEQLIRLYDFDAMEANQFCMAIQENLIDKKQTIDLHLLNFIQPINCNVSLHLANQNDGIQTLDHQNFVCNLTLESYAEIIKLCEPFCQNKSRGYRWLYDLDTPIDFLFSPHGTW